MSFVRLAPEQFDTIPEIAEPSEHTMLAGHDEAVAQVAAAYRAGKLHHALLIAGRPGIGKATFAFRLAHYLLAHPRHAEAPTSFVPPDRESPLFRQIAQAAHPSVLHLTRPANDRTKGFRTVVTVEEIRRVGRFLSMTSHDGGYRVVIVDPADDMNVNAANALLKSLEEPPPRTLFALISHSLGSLLPTIRSRCQVIKLRPLATPDLLGVLEGLGAEIPAGEGGRAALAERAGGSVREALLLTQFGGLDIAQAMAGIVAAPRFDIAEAWRVATAVSGRDEAVQFGIFNQTALDMVAGVARDAAAAGSLDAAARRADLWLHLERAVAETDTYNLDKKQHVADTLRRMHEALAG